MSSRRSRAQELARRVRRDCAMARPELRSAGDGCTRSAPASATSAPIKVEDPAVRAMIDAALAKRCTAQARTTS